jgi:hypothetical protein
VTDGAKYSIKCRTFPMQGPIGVFVHHNTLHAFQDLPFEQAVIEASRLFGAEPDLTKAANRGELARGRIHREDLDAVLDRDPGRDYLPQGSTGPRFCKAMMSCRERGGLRPRVPMLSFWTGYRQPSFCLTTHK